MLNWRYWFSLNTAAPLAACVLCSTVHRDELSYSPGSRLGLCSAQPRARTEFNLALIAPAPSQSLSTPSGLCCLALLGAQHRDKLGKLCETHSYSTLHESTCMAVNLQWSGMQPELMNSIRAELALHGAHPGASVASAFLICNSSPAVYLQMDFIWCSMCRCIS